MTVKTFLGKGKFASCYRVNRDGKDVALKMITCKNMSQYEKNMIIREIDIHKQLKHKNICELYSVPEDFMIYLELCDCNLKDIVLNSGLSYDTVRHYTNGLVDAIKYIHGMGIIHRDIKLGNVLLLGNTVKLSDFGFATKSTESFHVLGTPNYVAPEIIRCRKHKDIPYTNKVDIWSLGCCVFAMLNEGTCPFTGMSTEETLSNIENYDVQVANNDCDWILKYIFVPADERYGLDLFLSWSEGHPFSSG